METVHIKNLRPGQYINHAGEVVTLEQAKKVLESGAKPVLYTISDEYIGRVLDSLHDAREAGQEPGDFCEADPQAKRILYYPLPYCPVCGVDYGRDGIRRNKYCSNTEKHHGWYHGLLEWPHERVELVSSSYEDGGYKSGDVGTVIDVKTSTTGPVKETDLRVVWDNGAEECWISAEDFVGA